MKMTYSDLLSAFLDGTQNTGATDTNLLAFFQRSLNSRYQLMLAELSNYQTQAQRTASTVAAQQFYHYPVGVVQIETATVTVGSIAYPLTTINSQLNWDYLNELLISTTTIPRFIFPRRDDFGIYPIPQGVYTITLNYDIRDRALSTADYVTGTATTTNNSTTVTSGGGAIWTSAMAGRFFKVNANGYPYRITSVSGGISTLETSYEDASVTGGAYTIGESPELPEEGHDVLSTGTLADFFYKVRGDMGKGDAFNNIFWTGDASNKDRTGDNVISGLIGLKKRYAARSNSVIVKHMKNHSLGNEKLWGSSIHT